MRDKSSENVYDKLSFNFPIRQNMEIMRFLLSNLIKLLNLLKIFWYFELVQYWHGKCW